MEIIIRYKNMMPAKSPIKILHWHVFSWLSS